jgi:catechol 2,3-dioxygenase
MGESIHVIDPDGNGVELYYDRPRSDWPRRNGRIQLIAEPIDYDGLLATAKGDSIPAHVAEQTDIGHINLHVAELSEAERFFHDFLGFEVMARIPSSATFLAAGGYHHHVAVNTWAGKNPAPANSVGLISYRLVVPSAEVMTRLQDGAKPFGYDARTAKNLLQIRDPNGHLLELELQPEEAAAGIRHGINR